MLKWRRQDGEIDCEGAKRKGKWSMEEVEERGGHLQLRKRGTGLTCCAHSNWRLLNDGGPPSLTDRAERRIHVSDVRMKRKLEGDLERVRNGLRRERARERRRVMAEIWADVLIPFLMAYARASVVWRRSS